MTTVLTIVGLAIALAMIMAIAWAVVLRTGKSGWTDTFWSGGIGLVGVVAALLPLGPGEPMARAWIVAALVAIWSLRLALHIGRRTIRGGDDPRYAKLREEWGDRYRTQLFLFLQIQAGAALVLVLCVFAAARNPAPTGIFDVLGVLVCLGAIIGEGISDRQLRTFAADPANKGKVCDVGLWSVSRHPNYFFEWLYWVGYVPIGLSLPGYPWGLVALAAPVLMYWLLVCVSGIPLLEAHMLRSRGDAFRAYQARVRPFWPIPRSLS